MSNHIYFVCELFMQLVRIKCNKCNKLNRMHLHLICPLQSFRKLYLSIIFLFAIIAVVKRSSLASIIFYWLMLFTTRTRKKYQESPPGRTLNLQKKITSFLRDYIGIIYKLKNMHTNSTANLQRLRIEKKTNV